MPEEYVKKLLTDPEFRKLMQKYMNIKSEIIEHFEMDRPGPWDCRNMFDEIADYIYDNPEQYPDIEF